MVEVELTVRPSASAAIGVVAKGVDVHATLRVGVVAGQVIADGRLGTLGVLLEGYRALDVGVSTEDGDWDVLACTRAMMLEGLSWRCGEGLS